MITFETSVRVERPIEEVFAFVSNPLTFPQWNSAVQTVHGTSGENHGPGSTYSMRRELPTGHVQNELKVLDREHPTKFAIRTTSGPTPFLYHYRFDRDGADTVIHLDASVELPGATAVLGPIAARAVRRGVDANLAALKHELETGARNAMIPDHMNPTGDQSPPILDPRRHSRRLSVTSDRSSQRRAGRS